MRLSRFSSLRRALALDQSFSVRRPTAAEMITTTHAQFFDYRRRSNLVRMALISRCDNRFISSLPSMISRSCLRRPNRSFASSVCCSVSITASNSNLRSFERSVLMAALYCPGVNWRKSLALVATNQADCLDDFIPKIVSLHRPPLDCFANNQARHGDDHGAIPHIPAPIAAAIPARALVDIRNAPQQRLKQ